jgi:hypothetical protein
MALEEEMNNQFDQDDARLMIIMWDQYGLEAVIDVTQEQKNRLFDMIAGQDNSFDQWLSRTVSYSILRAQVNSQRNYEIYSVRVDSAVTADDMAQWFNDNPQQMADLMRQKGNSLYTAAGAGHRKQVIF